MALLLYLSFASRFKLERIIVGRISLLLVTCVPPVWPNSATSVRGGVLGYCIKRSQKVTLEVKLVVNRQV